MKISKELIASVVFFLTLVGLSLSLLATLETRDQLSKTRAELVEAKTMAADNLRGRDTGWAMYQADEVKLKDFQSECAGMNCKEMFNSESAGVISSTYWPMKMTVNALILFCHHSNLVNLGTNFPGAKLSSFSQIEEDRGVGPEYLITCAWLVPSTLWCQKEALNP